MTLDDKNKLRIFDNKIFRKIYRTKNDNRVFVRRSNNEIINLIEGVDYTAIWNIREEKVDHAKKGSCATEDLKIMIIHKQKTVALERPNWKHVVVKFKSYSKTNLKEE